MKHREHGNALLEYALLIGLIAVVAIAGLGMTGRATADAFEDAGEALQSSGIVTESPAPTEPDDDAATLAVEPAAVEAPALSLLPEPHGSGGGGGPNLVK